MRNILTLVFLFIFPLLTAQEKDSISPEDIFTLQQELQRNKQEIDSMGARVVTILTAVNELKQNGENHNRSINSLRSTDGKLSELIKELNQQNSIVQSRIDSLNQNITETNKRLIENTRVLGERIENTNATTTEKFSSIDNNLSRSQLFWILGALLLIILGGVLYFLLGKRINSRATAIQRQIATTSKNLKSIEEQSVRLDQKLVEMLDTQLKMAAETSKIPQTQKNINDHKLALKVADEIIRIQKNLRRMDETTKGLKQLSASVKRIQDNFAANGYELVDMLGKEYNEGMKATVNFVQDEDFEKGKKIITRVIKPQVNYQGVMIQTAQIEVTEA